MAGAVDGLHAHYQPIVAWPERDVVGYEALARTHEPGVDSADVLLELAKRLHRLDDVGRRMRVVAAESFESTLGPDLYINLHATDLLDPTLYDPSSVLSRMAPRVVFELTERCSYDSVVDLRDRLASLRALGFRIAVDDVGAGYSGLATFSTIDPSYVKLDLSLVRGLHASQERQEIVGSVVRTCGALGIGVIAEGVEAVEELKILSELGCGLFQGFLFARPAPEPPAVVWPAP
jgi:EAL domain-containing protein (putative c-di-GMP-specific phosphodiesterase class I)